MMRDPLFKICTRVPLLFGVPMVPLLFVNAIGLLIAFWSNQFYLAIFLIPIYLWMRKTTYDDEAKFSLLALRFKCRGLSNNDALYHKHAYSPVVFKKDNQL
ncbi:type IV secretion system protein VirB3 [Photobacterium phosphoreum]|jgi:type IV secretory pathway VirB3-like protein|uniref:type IV secretion system protein VirB3 n=1 Tax=Photobacterium phosphoreum TaxID=659 RepID=UPI002158EC27|nr:VirB3 family type IV secretion system protein [Photobacterium phosphoreum]